MRHSRMSKLSLCAHAAEPGHLSHRAAQLRFRAVPGPNVRAGSTGRSVKSARFSKPARSFRRHLTAALLRRLYRPMASHARSHSVSARLAFKLGIAAPPLESALCAHRKQPTAIDFDTAARNGVCAAASWIIPRARHRLRSVAS